MIETKIQMRFADVDMLGHVNNVNQQHYFDLGKSDFFRRVLGMKPVWKSEGLIMVSTRTDYRGQIRMGRPDRRHDMRRPGSVIRALRSGNRSSTPAPAK